MHSPAAELEVRNGLDKYETLTSESIRVVLSEDVVSVLIIIIANSTL